MLELRVPFILLLVLGTCFGGLFLPAEMVWHEVKIGGLDEELDWYKDACSGDSEDVWNIESE